MTSDEPCALLESILKNDYQINFQFSEMNHFKMGMLKNRECRPCLQTDNNRTCFHVSRLVLGEYKRIAMTMAARCRGNVFDMSHVLLLQRLTLALFHRSLALFRIWKLK